MLSSLFSLATICGAADTLPGALPRSTPEAQGISSAAIFDFVQSADRQVDAMNSFMLVRHGQVVAEGPVNGGGPILRISVTGGTIFIKRQR